MNGNLSRGQLLLVIIGIIFVIWILIRLLSRPKVYQVPIVPITRSPNGQAPIIAPVRPPALIRLPPGRQPSPTSPQQTPIISQPETSNILYYFFAPNCPHCTNFSPEWDDVVDRLKNYNNISAVKVDVAHSNNETLVFYYNINQLPTVILRTPDKTIEYTGNRTADDLYNFVLTNISQ